jgi:hypothetical protein
MKNHKKQMPGSKKNIWDLGFEFWSFNERTLFVPDDTYNRKIPVKKNIKA